MLYKSTENLPEKLSAVGFGCWSVASYNWSGADTHSAIRAIKTAIDAGTNFFDVAPVYGYGDSEKLLGRAIKGCRDKVFLATKCGLIWDKKDGPTRNNLTRSNILDEIDKSLLRMDVNYIDLYQMHWPDPNVSIEESMEAMKELIKQGKIRYVGLSNFSREDLERANDIVPIASYQGLYNLFDKNSTSYCGINLEYKTEDEIIPFCYEHGIAFIPYSPLCQGLLSGRYYKNRDKDLEEGDMRLTNPELIGECLNVKLNKVKSLEEISKETGLTLTELSLGWLVSNPAVTTVIAGSRTPQYALNNAEIGSKVLEQNIIDRIDRIF